MERALVAASAATHSLPRARSQSFLHTDRFSFMFSSGFASHKLQLDGRSRRSLVVAGTRKNKKKNSEEDDHSFLPRPDEATGPFPEAVLLKKKVVKEDGSVLPEFADAEEEKLFEFLSLQLESDLNLDKMRHYEVVYLIHEDCVDEVQSVISKVEEFIRDKKGRIWRLNNWGLRRLAYKIKKAKNAHYILMNFEIDAKFINDFKGMLDKDERIIRHLVMKQDKAITEDCPPPPEFHTLCRQNMDEDEDDEDVDAEVQSGDDGGELEDYDDTEDNIVFVDEDEDEDGVDDSSSRRTRSLKPEKVVS